MGRAVSYYGGFCSRDSGAGIGRLGADVGGEGKVTRAVAVEG